MTGYQDTPPDGYQDTPPDGYQDTPPDGYQLAHQPAQINIDN